MLADQQIKAHAYYNAMYAVLAPLCGVSAYIHLPLHLPLALSLQLPLVVSDPPPLQADCRAAC